MIDPLAASSRIAGSGMEAQSERMRVIAENIANAQSTGQTAGSDPYTADDHIPYGARSCLGDHGGRRAPDR